MEDNMITNISVSIYRQTLLGPNVFHLFFENVLRRSRHARSFEPLRLLLGCGRRSCCCGCLVVGKVAVVLISAGVLEVSGKDREAKQSKRRGLSRGTIWSQSRLQEIPGGR